MIGKDREVNDGETLFASDSDAVAQDLEDVLASKAGKSGAKPERDVNRMSRAERGPRRVPLLAAAIGPARSGATAPVTGLGATGILESEREPRGHGDEFP